MSKFVIALDGPAASGKSTIAAKLADRTGAFYVNTGELYRTVTLAALRSTIHNDADLKKYIESQDIDYHLIDDRIIILWNGDKINQSEIRSSEVTEAASTISQKGFVRKFLLEKQRNCQSLGNIIMEGRDIATVVFPNADFKFFIDASAEVRARRRLAQENETPDNSTLESVIEAIKNRDSIDMNRKIAPLRPSEDSIRIDTTDLCREDVINKIMNIIEDKS